MSIKIVAHINRKDALRIINKSVMKVEYLRKYSKIVSSNGSITMKSVKLILIMNPSIVPKTINRVNFMIFIEFVSIDSSISKGLSLNNLKTVKEINKVYEKINVIKKRIFCPKERNTNENEIKNMINEIYL